MKRNPFVHFVIAVNLFAFMLIGLLSCTENARARRWGGEETIQLPAGQKLISATWQESSDLWYLTEPMEEGYEPKTKVFQENSVYGTWEGKVIFVESR